MQGQTRNMAVGIVLAGVAALVILFRPDGPSLAQRSEMFAAATGADFHGLDPKGDVVAVTGRNRGGPPMPMLSGGCTADDPFQNRRYEAATIFLCHGYTTTPAGPLVVLFTIRRVQGLLEDRNAIVLESSLIDPTQLDRTRREHGIALPALPK